MTALEIETIGQVIYTVAKNGAVCDEKEAERIRSDVLAHINDQEAWEMACDATRMNGGF